MEPLKVIGIQLPVPLCEAFRARGNKLFELKNTEQLTVFAGDASNNSGKVAVLVQVDSPPVELLGSIRARGIVGPVIGLTNEVDERNEIDFMTGGGERLLCATTSVRILEEVLRQIIRRTGKVTPGRMVFGKGRLYVVPEKRNVFADGKLLDLTHTEFDILLMLARVPNTVWSRKKIKEAIESTSAKAESTDDDRIIDSHFKRIRKEIGEKSPGAEEVLVTVYGVGYSVAL